MPWVELIDPGTGQPYYYNEETGQTAIERPAGKLGTAQPVEVYHERAKLPAMHKERFDPEDEERRVQGIYRASRRGPAAALVGRSKPRARRNVRPRKRGPTKRRSSSKGSRGTRAKGRGRGRGASSRTHRRGRGRGRQ